MALDPNDPAIQEAFVYLRIGDPLGYPVSVIKEAMIFLQLSPSRPRELSQLSPWVREKLGLLKKEAIQFTHLIPIEEARWPEALELLIGMRGPIEHLLN